MIKGAQPGETRGEGKKQESEGEDAGRAGYSSRHLSPPKARELGLCAPSGVPQDPPAAIALSGISGFGCVRAKDFQKPESLLNRAHSAVCGSKPLGGAHRKAGLPRIAGKGDLGASTEFARCFKQMGKDGSTYYITKQRSLSPPERLLPVTSSKGLQLLGPWFPRA